MLEFVLLIVMIALLVVGWRAFWLHVVFNATYASEGTLEYVVCARAVDAALHARAATAHVAETALRDAITHMPAVLSAADCARINALRKDCKRLNAEFHMARLVVRMCWMPTRWKSVAAAGGTSKIRLATRGQLDEYDGGTKYNPDPTAYAVANPPDLEEFLVRMLLS